MRRVNLLLPMIVLALAGLACNVSGGGDAQATQTTAVEIAATVDAVATTGQQTQEAAAAPPTETPTEVATPTETPLPTQTAILNPFLTADVNSNVRGGPGTIYDILGNLLQGQMADIIGRNSGSSWWVIVFAPGPDGKGWISDSIVTVSGDTSNVPIVAAPPTPTPSPSGDWLGTWMTNCGGSNCGTMELAQVGNNVSGTYASGDGTLSGTVDGSHLSGTWSRNGGSGTFDFWVTANGQRFRGNWDRYHDWCGHREGSSDPSPCGVASWYGTWTTNCSPSTCGNIIITQDGENIEGSYAGGDGSISGTVSGNELTGSWYRNNSSGSIQFFMFSNANQFNGNYNGSSGWCGYRGAAGQPGTCKAP